MSKIFAVEYHYVTDQDEAMAEVRPRHRAFNAELAAMFTRDLSLCRRVPARRQLSFSQRLLEATARLFSRVL